MFFMLCWFSWRAFYFQDRFSWLQRHALWSGYFFTSFYGILDEFHQLYVPGRSADFYDIIADIIGASIFLGLQLYRTGRASREISKKQKIGN